MKNFAFITHPENSEQLRKIWPAAKFMPNFLIPQVLPLKIFPVKNVISAQGGQVHGVLVTCPILASQFPQTNHNFLARKVMLAAQIAKEAGARILGLGGCFSGLTEKCGDFKSALKIPVTTGDAFSAWSIFEAAYRMAKAKKLNLEKINLVVFGAVSAIGFLCAQKIAAHVAKIILVDTNQANLGRLKDKILDLNQVEVEIEADVNRAAKESDIIIIADDPKRMAINPQEFKPGSIVCCPSLYATADFKAGIDSNITFVEAGLIKLFCAPDFGVAGVWPQDLVSASFAETMLLALENRFVHYSRGQNTSLDKLEEIADIATRHGFEVWVPEAPVV